MHDIKGNQGWLLVGVTHEIFETLLFEKIKDCLYNFPPF